MKKLCKVLLIPVLIISCLMITGCSGKENEKLYDLSCEKGYDGSYGDWEDAVATKEVQYRFLDDDIQWNNADTGWEVLYTYDSSNDWYDELNSEKWSQYYRVSFYDGDTLIEVKNVLSGNAVQSANYNKDGYELEGWYNGSVKYVFSSKVNAPLTLNTEFVMSSYSIKYDLDGGEVDTPNITTCTIETIETLNSPTRLGYTFAGWLESGETHTGKIENVTKNLSFTATWTEQTIKINYNVGEGSTTNVTSYKLSDGTVDLTLPVQTGYQLNYWYIGTDESNKIYSLDSSIFDIVSSGEITLNASYDNLDIYTINNVQFLDFGSYPMSEVTDSLIISNLNTTVATNDLGYKTYNGNEYYNNNDSYYLVETITWRVLVNSNGTLEVVAESILDTTLFDDSSSNYATSNIREFLNNDFMNRAFTTEEQFVIETSILSDVECSDKVYLLSNTDATKLASVQTSATAFAVGNGCTASIQGLHSWWTRTKSSSNVFVFTNEETTRTPSSTSVGVRPAFTFGSN